VNIDRGQFVGRGLKDAAVVMDLHEFAPVGGRAASGRHRWWLERFAEVCEGLTSRGRSHPGLLPLANLRFEVSRLLPAGFSEPNVTAAVRALERKLLPHPGHQFRPCNPRGAVRAGLRLSIAAARGMPLARMPSVAPRADVGDRERSDGGPELVIGRKDAVIAMPVLPRWGHEIGQPVQKLKRRELDDAVGPCPRGLAAGRVCNLP
jgi:hypothetical protein